MEDFSQPYDGCRSLFDQAVALVLKHEGGYVNDPEDPGGETNFGITKRNYPTLDIKKLTVDEAIDIYRNDWWNKWKFQNLPHKTAIKVFDLAVNMGPKHTFRILQESINACGISLFVDGTLGKATISAANEIGDDRLLPIMIQDAKAYYLDLTNLHPALKRFEKDWLDRAGDMNA